MARRRIIVFVVLGIAAYALAMLATIPASVILKPQPWRTGVAGTLWNGEVGMIGGSRIAWRMAPLRSLTSLAFAADLKGSGPDTDFGGRMLVHPGGRTIVDNLSGSAQASLFETIAPNLPFTCAMPIQIKMKRIAMGGGSRMMEGTVTSDPGTCRTRTGGPATAVPALILTAEHIGNVTRIHLAPMTQRRKLLLEATLAESGIVDLSVTPDGAAMLPFLQMPPGARIRM